MNQLTDGFELIEKNGIYLVFKDLDLVGYGNEEGIIHTAQYDDLEKKRLEHLGAKVRRCTHREKTSWVESKDSWGTF